MTCRPGQLYDKAFIPTGNKPDLPGPRGHAYKARLPAGDWTLYRKAGLIFLREAAAPDLRAFHPSCQNPACCRSPCDGQCGLSIKGEGFELGAEVSVPAGLAGTADLLPLAQGLSDRVVQETTKPVEEAGHRNSCRKGEQYAADDSGEVMRVRILMPGFHAVAQYRTGPELLQELLELRRVKREL